ncbi:MAG TPA: efflux RND transporter periplasmic adaptor subunit [Desulfobacterales bacterium]|jgi:Cu(I)/Ag(I) efflux system membrane fusion protein|nr:efflux RND transporter periplasmic adaptor subunit [Desulfobacterales bacterium]
MKPFVFRALAFVAAVLLLVGAAAAPVAAQSGHAGHSATAPAKADDLDISGLTMESLQKEGKMVEVAPGTVQISPERQQLIGVRIGTVEKRPLQKVIRTNGRVEFDEKRLATISPKIGGWIEELYVDFTGAPVKKGAPLLTLYSPELVSTQEEYLAALRARQELAASPYPEVAASGNALVESARRRLRLWDISEEQIRELEQTGHVRKSLTLYSPYSGIVLEKMAFKGMRVEPGMALYKLADLTVVWLIADIYEYELPLIRLGQQASINLSYLPGEAFTGKAVFIYPYLDAQTRTARVRFEFANPRGTLKPEMYAGVEITIRLGDKVAVPEGAIIDTGIRKVAIVEKGAGYFEPRDVKLGTKAGDYYEVLDGLKVGERVVISANFLIDSESKLKEAVGGAGHQHGQ